ncbi:PPE domain-containing protein [Nocardia vermiculata]|uniref:PPE domain-containing protein n=2 Tax=Nocardia vermiculata TaxID=257274 RepID=A0A846Y9W5_9NOCA|nr:PPE domain-containing protein [Nocardia vermiculata]
MAMNVDPAELVSAAAALADMARTTGGGLPKSWVVPAGADPISAQAVPQLNAGAQDLYNGVLGTLNEVHRTAHNIGAAAVDYTLADDEGGREVAGSGADLESNPVAELPPHTARSAPRFTLPAVGAEVDPLTFAKQLHTGPGPGGAARFAEKVRTFLSTTHTDAVTGLDRAAQTMQHWTPVGSQAALELTERRGWLDELGSALGRLADGAENYSNAFTAAKAKHPTPQEIIAARKELVAAMRSKNELGVQDALAKTQEQNARSAQTVSDYSIAVGSETPSESGKSGESEAGAAQSGSNGNEMNMLAQMLPSLLSSLMQGGMMSQMGDSTDALTGLDDSEYGYDYGGYEDYGAGGYGGGSAMPIGDITSGIGAGGDVPAVSVGAMPTVASASTSSTAGSNAPNLPRASVIEPLSSSASSAARGMHPGGGMPYMPMAPGMGGAGGGNNERNRVVAWHPDRLMYVDDTPHTEQVIGEKPTIAPSVTPPTPSPANQTPSRSGGSA